MMIGLAGIAVLLGALFVGVNVWRASQQAATVAPFWAAKANEPVPANGFRLVALGDSATEAIGANHPMDGFVGRIATYVQQRTGRPVHIVNVAGGDTYSGVVQRQLPKVDLTTADLVIVACSNDLESRTSLETYRAALDTLLRALPASKTIISDFPLEPGRESYQRILQERTDAAGIARADFARVFNGEGRRLDIFSWLPPHLNSKGYYYWFLAFRPQVGAMLARITSLL